MTQNSPGHGDEPTAGAQQWQRPNDDQPAEPGRAPAWQSPAGQPVSGAPAWQSSVGQQPQPGVPAWQASPAGQPHPGGQQHFGAQQQSGAPAWPPAPPGWRPAGPMPHAWAPAQAHGQGQWQAGPRPIAYPSPVRFEGVPGEPFALAILPTPKVVSGVSAGALVAGLGSILVSGAVWCFGLAGASQDWGALVGGAFFVLAALLGLAAVGLGVVGLRNIRRDSTKVITGKGYAISGLSCGGFGVVSAVLGLATAILLTRGA